MYRKILSAYEIKDIIALPLEKHVENTKKLPRINRLIGRKRNPQYWECLVSVHVISDYWNQHTETERGDLIKVADILSQPDKPALWQASRWIYLAEKNRKWALQEEELHKLRASIRHLSYARSNYEYWRLFLLQTEQNKTLSQCEQNLFDAAQATIYKTEGTT